MIAHDDVAVLARAEVLLAQVRAREQRRVVEDAGLGVVDAQDLADQARAPRRVDEVYVTARVGDGRQRVDGRPPVPIAPPGPRCIQGHVDGDAAARRARHGLREVQS